MIYLLIIPLIIYALWIFFLATMNLKRVADLNQLTPLTKILGTPILLIGYTLDVIVNVFVMTFIFLELPKEYTVSSRLARHNTNDGSIRARIAKFFEPILDPFDPSGDHI